jgi:hypothetical protein
MRCSIDDRFWPDHGPAVYLATTFVTASASAALLGVAHVGSWQDSFRRLVSVLLVWRKEEIAGARDLGRDTRAKFGSLGARYDALVRRRLEHPSYAKSWTDLTMSWGRPRLDVPFDHHRGAP